MTTIRSVSPQRVDHLVDRVVDVGGRVIGDAWPACRPAGPSGSTSISSRDRVDDIERVGVRQDEDAHEDRGLAGEADFGVVVLGAQLDVGDVAQAHDRVVLLADDEVLELLDRAQIGVGRQVDLDQGALGVADGGQVVVRGERRADLRRADVERRQPVGLEPDAHREGAAAEDVGALHARDRREARLHDAHQVVRDLVLLQNLRGETQVGRGELRVGGLDVDRGNLRLRRQVVAHLVHLGADFRQRLVRVVIELQTRGDRGDALRRSWTGGSRCRPPPRWRARAGS